MTRAAARFVAHVIDNLIGGLRVAAGRAPGAREFHAGAAHLAFALAAYWVLLVLGARLAAGTDAAFWTWGLSGALARFHVWLCAVLALAWLAGMGRRAGTLLVVLLYAALPVAVLTATAHELAALLAPEAAPHFAAWRERLGIAWLVLVFARATGLAGGLDAGRRAAATLAYAGVLALAAHYLPAPPLFYRALEVPPALDVEAVYYRQPALLERALAALRAQDPGRVDLYFLGVAPYAGEDVFVREMRAARAIVERRLGLGGRTLALINHRDTLDELPLANPPNLARALAGLGRVIDRDEDIVFVFLSSHGDEQATLAAEFGALAPNAIDAYLLREALDAAAIRWRVLVISACYSGSFIAPLRSPTTLIVTAAAADRASFGCSHENHWTYFGEAYFADALARTTDPLAAARLARETIGRRERREGKAPSRPQIVAGARIAEQLRRWRADAGLTER